MRHKYMDSIAVWARLTPIVGLALCACSGGEKPEAPAPAAAKPQLTRVTAERKDLLFRYTVEGKDETTDSLDRVPTKARGAVQGIDLSNTPTERTAPGHLQAVDLRTARADGSYPGELVERAQLEKTLAARAAANRPKHSAVTMYSASWCGVCNKARKFLTKEGIPFREIDVEKDKPAAEALAVRAKKQGVDTSGVPIFAVGQKIVGGFDEKGLLALIKKGG